MLYRLDHIPCDCCHPGDVLAGLWIPIKHLFGIASVICIQSLLLHMDTSGTDDVAALVEDISLLAMVHDLFKPVLVCLLTERLQHSSVC